MVTLLAFVRDRAAVIREAVRVLRPDGILLIGALGRWSVWAAIRRVRGGLGDRIWRGARFWTAGELRRLLRREGLEVVGQVGAVRYPPWARLVQPSSTEAGEDEASQLEDSDRTRPGMLGPAFIAVAARRSLE